MDYLKVWTSFRTVLAPLSDDEKGRLFDMMLLYAESGEEPDEFIGNERFLWNAAKQDIDRTAQKAETLRANASKGGIAKSKNKQLIANDSKSYQTLANDTNCEQNEANAAHNIKKYKEKKYKENTPSEYKRFTPPTLDEVKAYCSERQNEVDPEKFIDFYASKGWKVGNQPMKDWKACVRTWERGASKQPVRIVPDDPGRARANQRDYSEKSNEAMKRMLEQMEAVGI